MQRTIKVQYFAVLREKRGVSEETVRTTAATALALYTELAKKHKFTLDSALVRVAVNKEFREWDAPLQENDQVVFIPPVAGG